MRSDPRAITFQYFRLLFVKGDHVHKLNQRIPQRVSPVFDSKHYIGSGFPFSGLPVILLNSLEGCGYWPKEMVNPSQTLHCLKYLLRQEFIALL